MTIDPSAVPMDYRQGVSGDAAANAGRQAAQNGQELAPQQPNKSADAYIQRQNAYNQAQGEKK